MQNIFVSTVQLCEMNTLKTELGYYRYSYTISV